MAKQNDSGYLVMSTKKRTHEIVAVGYVKEEDGVFTAICVNMSLFAQGKTPDQALKKIMGTIDNYLQFVFEEPSNKWRAYLNRPVPNDMMLEYLNTLTQLATLSTVDLPARRTKTGSKTHPFLPVRSFAQPISIAQA